MNATEIIQMLEVSAGRWKLDKPASNKKPLEGYVRTSPMEGDYPNGMVKMFKLVRTINGHKIKVDSIIIHDEGICIRQDPDGTVELRMTRDEAEDLARKIESSDNIEIPNDKIDVDDIGISR